LRHSVRTVFRIRNATASRTTKCIGKMTVTTTKMRTLYTTLESPHWRSHRPFWQ